MSRAIRFRPERRPTFVIGGALTLALLAASIAGPAAADVAPPTADYRLDNYRAAVPQEVPGGTAIDTDKAAALWREHGALFVDVLRAPRRPAGLPKDAIWKPLPRHDIPGSLWLPDVGLGTLDPRLDAWFREQLLGATHGDRAAPIVFYCLANCWMSWNATKRAASYGFTKLYWYRDGTDGWEKQNLPTEEATPAPGRP
jgi:PQQ-dependent catabolism-associated CXXCW motif protein